MNIRFRETRKRSAVKSTTFRIVVIISDLIVVYTLTHQIGTTIAVTVATNVASTILYFLHERFWDTIDWGKWRSK